MGQSSDEENVWTSNRNVMRVHAGGERKGGGHNWGKRLKFCEVNDKFILNRVLMLGCKTETIIGLRYCLVQWFMQLLRSINKSREDERAGAEIVYGSEECYQHSIELLDELGFPRGVLPLQDLEECGRVRETGFVWMKHKAPFEHFFHGTNTLVSYATEVTAYVEKSKMKKMTGVKSKQMFLWVPIVEMSIEDPAKQKIHFKTPMGIGKSYPITAFMTTDKEKLKANE
ncbi:hypothetical protein F0562_011381 [Nyssa sinensis]|uniref:DUF538 domain-containing protein n=1 Tax=Nyssa sinensis TaxID=561372 RepID=A0A5J5A6C6_9ASTE|nr:hypothetical protein F0562_011381 [Nyssa sinensis]